MPGDIAENVPVDLLENVIGAVIRLFQQEKYHVYALPPSAYKFTGGA